MPTTPLSLLQRLCQPEADEKARAWARFVELYTPLLFAWACRLQVPEQDAADLVQDVFLKLVRQLPGFRYEPGRSFRGWLRTLLLHQWQDQLRRVRAPAAVSPEGLAAPGPGPIEELAEAEYRQHLAARALQLMRSDFAASTWQACWETVVRERPAAEVAGELGLSVAAVYAASSRVLRRLRQELQGLLV
jgi:RNA polymerase sigma-70 factor (ECF subfamily)